MVDDHDTDEHPSLRRAAGRVLHGEADWGVAGAVLALAGAVGARRRGVTGRRPG